MKSRKPNVFLKLKNCRKKVSVNTWRGVVDAMRTCSDTHAIVVLMSLRSSYFRKWLIKTGDKFGVIPVMQLQKKDCEQQEPMH